MGCGALITFRSTKTNTEVVSTSCERDSTEDIHRNESDDDEKLDTLSQLSPCPSVHTIQSSITNTASLHTGLSGQVSGNASASHSGRFTGVAKGSSFSQYSDGGDMRSDLRSDVPTIAETIADMQDFQDLAPCTRTSSLCSGRSSKGGSENNDDSNPNLTPRHSKEGLFGGSGSYEPHKISIDSRMHPLAVINDMSSCSPAVGDLGTHSEVPSIRDDMSVTSAPSEICVSFPPSIYCSESGTLTPARQRMHQLDNLPHNYTRLNSGSAPFKRSSSERSSSSFVRQIEENPLLMLVAQGAEDSSGAQRRVQSEPYESSEIPGSKEGSFIGEDPTTDRTGSNRFYSLSQSPPPECWMNGATPLPNPTALSTSHSTPPDSRFLQLVQSPPKHSHSTPPAESRFSVRD